MEKKAKLPVPKWMSKLCPSGMGWISQPFMLDGWLYATDGHRIIGIKGIFDAPILRKLKARKGVNQVMKARQYDRKEIDVRKFSRFARDNRKQPTIAMCGLTFNPRLVDILGHFKGTAVAGTGKVNRGYTEKRDSIIVAGNGWKFVVMYRRRALTEGSSPEFTAEAAHE